jgi:hypothetical protein
MQLKTFYPWRIPRSKHFTLEEFQALKNFNVKPLYRWRIQRLKPFTSEEPQAQNPLPLNNSKLKTLYRWRILSSEQLTPDEFQAQNPLSQKNPRDLRQERILNGIVLYVRMVYIVRRLKNTIIREIMYVFLLIMNGNSNIFKSKGRQYHLRSKHYNLISKSNIIWSAMSEYMFQNCNGSTVTFTNFTITNSVNISQYKPKWTVFCSLL